MFPRSRSWWEIPAVVTGYVDTLPEGREARLKPRRASLARNSSGQRVSSMHLLGGATLVQLPRITDGRGHLSFGEIQQSLPFAPARYFSGVRVPSREVRGEHAPSRACISFP